MTTIELGKTYIAQVKPLNSNTGNRCKVIPVYINKEGSIYCRNLTNQNYCTLQPCRILHEVQ